MAIHNTLVNKAMISRPYPNPDPNSNKNEGSSTCNAALQPNIIRGHISSAPLNTPKHGTSDLTSIQSGFCFFILR